MNAPKKEGAPRESATPNNETDLRQGETTPPLVNASTPRSNSWKDESPIAWFSLRAWDRLKRSVGLADLPACLALYAELCARAAGNGENRDPRVTAEVAALGTAIGYRYRKTWDTLRLLRDAGVIHIPASETEGKAKTYTLLTFASRCIPPLHDSATPIAPGRIDPCTKTGHFRADSSTRELEKEKKENRQPSMWELKTQKEAIEKCMAALKNKSSVETATGRTWNVEADRIKHKELRLKLEEIEERLAGC